MTSKAGHMVGPVRVSLDTAFVRDATGRALASIYGEDKDCRVDDVARARTKLVGEAFDTLSETGLTPRQLAEQRDALLKALKVAASCLASTTQDSLYDNAKAIISAAIAKATAGGAV